MSAVIEVEGLRKTYRTPLRRKKVEAVRGLSFAVEQGEIFGFLGPNGAGKTTTIRMLMGLIRPSGGHARIFGHAIPSRAARQRLGFLPESPYFYDYLTVAEVIDLAGRLFGIDRAERASRADRLIHLVGLDHARNTPLKKYSKGMLQRAGIAQALINDPDLVVFDEPMSGLDPIGRKEVRDIILTLREQGKTVFFSSHILGDVELVCDRVAIVVRGELHDLGAVDQLVSKRLLGTEVTLRLPADPDEAALEGYLAAASDVRRTDRDLVVLIGPDADVDEFLANGREHRLRVVSVVPRHETLEQIFIRRARGEGEAA
jgi:ABC-2 type transport system ATP-binding protein